MAASRLQRFEGCLALADYMLDRFGVANVQEPEAVQRFYINLAELPEGYDEEYEGFSYLYAFLRPLVRGISTEKLRQYDRNIRQHFEAIAKQRPAVITLKYFQVLAALMTEYYLDRYFSDSAALLNDLNQWVALQNEARRDGYPSFVADDLNKVAFWMATGSGKTLLMHINLRQYLHYAPQPPNNILLVTPDEGLSRQHIADLAASSIPAVHFNAQQTTLLGNEPEAVKVIEIHKIKEETSGGGKSIEVSSLERDNLVLVDEGHKGGKSEAQTWRNMRAEAARDGFTFEYSATFGQAIVGDAALEEEYSKSILFDYAYRRFHADGYGKDYRILNLERELDDGQPGLSSLTQRYMLANLLTFYEQWRWFARERDLFSDEYNIAPPLLVFIGHTVNASTNTGKADKQAFSDVLTVVHFLHDVLRNRDGWVPSALESILNGTAGLVDEAGSDLFATSFRTLRGVGLSGEAIYSGMLSQIFHARASADLHLVNLKNADGEIGLRAGESDSYFGVINIGDDSSFLKMVEERAPELQISEQHFGDSLFDNINRPDSSVTIVIGSRKFIEGWDSWRVSAMGLMNFGSGEGPLIIQLFGRGVRLLGYGHSLKRSGRINSIPHPTRIEILETLQIFGVRANYMTQFRKYLEQEGIDTDPRELIVVPTEREAAFQNKGLLIIRPRHTVPFEQAGGHLYRASIEVAPSLDLTPRLSGLASAVSQSSSASDSARENPLRTIPAHYVPMLDWNQLYATVWRWSRDPKGYTNIAIDPKELRRLIDEEWYELRCPAELLEPKLFAELQRIEAIVEQLLKRSITRFYSNAYRAWESTQLSYQPLKEDDSNLIRQWEAYVKQSAPEELRNALSTMRESPERYESDNGLPSRVHFDRHLYLPLLLQEDDEADVIYSPPGLNRGESQFVQALRDFCKSDDAAAILEEWELFLLRNQSRGQGVGFLVGDSRYFPDFILWLRRPNHQHIAFIDPKGLLTGGNLAANPKVQFHRTLQNDYQPILNKGSNRSDVTLHAFIISQTNFQTLRQNQSSQFQERSGFHRHHVYFQEDGGQETVKRLLDAMLQSQATTVDG